METADATAFREQTPVSATEPPLVAAVLSRRLGRIRHRAASASTARLCRLLAYAGGAEVPRPDAPLAAICPGLEARVWPTAETAMKRLGRTQSEIREQFEEAEHHAGVCAVLPEPLLAAFVPRELWPVLEALAWDGPSAYAERIRRGLRSYAMSEVPGNRHRPPGRPSRGTVVGLRDDALALARLFVELRRESHPSPALKPWVAAPAIQAPTGGRSGVNTSAPRPEQVRLAFSGLDHEIRRLLDVRDGESEIEAIERLSPTALFRKPLFRPMRDRAALLLMVLTGGRVTAVASLTKADYDRDHQGIAPDYRHGPAIRLRPGKHLELDEIRWKPIPAGAARMIDAYLLVVEQGFAMVARRAAKDRLRHGSRFERPPDDYPLLLSDRLHFEPWAARGIRTRLSGIVPGERTRGVEPLIVREDVGNSDLTTEQRRYVGFSPHRYRHLAQQLAERAGAIWNEEHPPSGATPAPEPALYGSALLDHRSFANAMRVLYGDWSTAASYETLSGRAAELMWELLTTSRGSRKRPDLGAIRRASSRFRLLEAQIQQCEERVARMQSEGRSEPPAKRVYEEAPADAGADELLRRNHRLAIALAEGQQELRETVETGQRRIEELLGLAAATASLREQRDRLVAELTALVYEERTWELVPDDAPPGADRTDVDLAALLAGEEPEELPALEEPEPDAVRDWILPSEMAEVCEIGNRSRLSRWAEGTHLPREPHRRPWEAGAVPIDDSLGRNFRRIWVPGIQDSFWPSETARQRVAELMRHWPIKQGWSRGNSPGPRCLAPLELAEPFASEREAT